MLPHQNAPLSPQKNSLFSQSLHLPPLALPASLAPFSVKSESENDVSINTLLNSAKKFALFCKLDSFFFFFFSLDCSVVRLSSGLSQLASVADANQSAVNRISASIESRSKFCTQVKLAQDLFVANFFHLIWFFFFFQLMTVAPN
jgi:hypothetical protein